MSRITAKNMARLTLATLTLAWPMPSLAQVAPTAPVQMVITAEARHGGDVPTLSRGDVIVYQGRDRDQVTGLIPLQGSQARIELFVLLDDALRASLGPQLDDIQAFIIAQPKTTAVGVGYMRDGTVDVAQTFTTDHVRAANSLRLPLGNAGAIASPYLSLENLIAHWPATPPPQEPLMDRWPAIPIRHEVVMITDGIDRFGGDGPVDPYVNEASDDAQTAGVIIYAIYASGVGPYAGSLWRRFWGQTYLSQITDQTGGELYYLGYETPPSFGPYLDDVSRKLNHQYLLAFFARLGKKAGLQRVRLRSELTNAELMAAENVWVPGESD